MHTVQHDGGTHIDAGAARKRSCENRGQTRGPHGARHCFYEVGGATSGRTVRGGKRRNARERQSLSGAQHAGVNRKTMRFGAASTAIHEEVAIAYIN